MRDGHNRCTWAPVGTISPADIRTEGVGGSGPESWRRLPEHSGRRHSLAATARHQQLADGRIIPQGRRVQCRPSGCMPAGRVCVPRRSAKSSVAISAESRSRRRLRNADATSKYDLESHSGWWSARRSRRTPRNAGLMILIALATLLVVGLIEGRRLLGGAIGGSETAERPRLWPKRAPPAPSPSHPASEPEREEAALLPEYRSADYLPVCRRCSGFLRDHLGHPPN